MRKKACLCKEGWTGPHCKQRTYGDDDARGPIRLPVHLLQPPTSLTIFMTLLAIGLTAAVMSIVNTRRDEAAASSARSEDGYRPIPRG